MSMYQHVSKAFHLLILVLLIVLLGTCASSVYFMDTELAAAAPDVSATLTSLPRIAADSPVILDNSGSGIPSAALIVPTPAPTFPPSGETAPGTGLDTGWSVVQPGLERRVIQVYSGQSQIVESLHIWRLDQTYFRLDIAYDQTPKSLETWQRETNAFMVVNGGFYSIENERYFPDGLTVVNGKASGRSFTSGGMLAIQASGAELRWLAREPYDSGEQLQAALQSFPVLVEPGGGLGFSAERESNASARRTVIGQDKDGRILFIIAPVGYFTLHQLSAYLTTSDLNLDMALNLDGGGSTGILVTNPRELIPPSRLIPFVILVHAR